MSRKYLWFSLRNAQKPSDLKETNLYGRSHANRVFLDQLKLCSANAKETNLFSLPLLPEGAMTFFPSSPILNLHSQWIKIQIEAYFY